MNKILLLILIVPFLVQSQWITKSSSNKFDGDYKVAAVTGKGGEFPYTKPTLVISKFDSSDPNIFLSNIGYTGCGKPSIEITFNDSKDIYTYESFSNRDNDEAILSFTLSQSTIYYKSLSLEDLMKLFKEKNKVYIRYASDCGLNDFEFTLSGSSRAINYVLGDYMKNLSNERKLKNEKEKNDQVESQSIINKLNESFNCDAPLAEIITFNPSYNNMPIKLLNSKLYEESLILGKSNKISIYNKWKDKTILISVERYSFKNVFYANPSTLWKLTDNEIVEFIKNNYLQLAKDCETLTENQLKLLKQ